MWWSDRKMRLAGCCKGIQPWTVPWHYLPPSIPPPPPFAGIFKDLRNEEAGSCTGWRFRANDDLFLQHELCHRHLPRSERTSAILLIQSHRLLCRHLLFPHTWFLNAAVGSRRVGFSPTQKCVLNRDKRATT